MIKKLMLSGILLGLGLEHTAIANGATQSAENANFPQSSPLTHAAVTNAVAASASTTELADASDQPTASPSSLRRVLLSNLLLPLPPLLLPDLLMPPYDFPSFSSPRLDQELKLYTQYLRTTGTPDILIIGSSRSLQGVDPAALEQGLAQQGYPGLNVFNLGINGGTASVNQVLLQQILTAEQLPRLILWADGSRAFNNGRPDLTHSGILASAGYQRLTQGDRPIPSQARWDLPILRAAASKVLSASDQSAAAEPAESDLNQQGFQTVPAVFSPETYYQRYPHVPGSYDADYQNFNLNGAQQTAAAEIARFARSRNIPLVFVNLPVTANYLDATRRSYEQQFRQNMQDLAQREQFIFADLSQQTSLMQNDYFMDPSHINQHGAQAVALHLAAMPSIPWSRLRSAD